MIRTHISRRLWGYIIALICEIFPITINSSFDICGRTPQKITFGDKPDINYDILFINPIYQIPFYSRIREIDRGHETPKICFNLSDFLSDTPSVNILSDNHFYYSLPIYISNFRLFLRPTQKINCLRQLRTRKTSNKQAIRFVLLTLKTRIFILSTLNV